MRLRKPQPESLLAWAAAGVGAVGVVSALTPGFAHRFEIVGGWWVEPDCNIPGGEGFVRHALYSQRCAAMLAALDEYMPPGISWTRRQSSRLVSGSPWNLGAPS